MANRKNKKKNKANSKSKSSAKRPPHSPKQSNLPTLPSSNFSIFITMESDWHIGSGGGIPGNIDSLVQRDSEGIPGFISAKTLTGVWRDACEAVALGLDGGTEGIWSQYVVYLFGEQPALNEDSAVANSPISAALNIRPAQLHPDIRNAILDRPDVAKQALIRAMTMNKPGISIDPKTGCAIEKFLRQEEMVRMGTYLTSQCQLNLEKLDDKQKRAAWALLIAGAKYLDRLGGKRRRGAGQCRLELAGVKDINSWLEWLGNNCSQAKEFKHRENNSDRSNELLATSSNEKQAWYKIPLTITTKLPIIIKSRTIGNIVETLDYIPANRLLPIVAKKLGGLGINIVEAISSQQLIITNATVKVDNQGGRPVPLALFYEKMSGGFDKGQVYNQLIETPSEDKQLKGYRQGYVSSIATQNGAAKLPEYTTVNTVIKTHNTIDDASQRPTEEIGGVYSYQAIEAGTILQAEVRLTQNLIDTLSKNTQWWQKLEGQENIGTSKKDDYGLVEIESSKPTKIEAKNNLVTSVNSKKHQLIVWLLSDVLIRDRQLRPSISLNDFQQTLERTINRGIAAENKVKLTLELKDNSQADSFPLAYIRQRRTESWQKRWCLPRPSLTGLMAGSCIKFSLETNLDNAELNRRLEQIAIVGIGERTIEGYGQIAFNDDLLKQEISQIKAQSELNNSTDKPVGTVEKIAAVKKSFAYARLIETQAWRSEISNAAKALASSPENRKSLLGIRVVGTENPESYPSMSQLGNLRTFIARLQEPRDINLILGWIEDNTDTSQIKEFKPQLAKKWKKTSGGLDKIRTLVTSDSFIWNELAKHTSIPLECLAITENVAEFLTSEQWEQLKEISIADYLNNKNNPHSLRLILWSEAVRTVVYECIRAHKRNFEPG